VLTARPGTPLAEIEGCVAASAARCWPSSRRPGPMFGAGRGATIGGGTLGGALGARLRRPAPLYAGAARDHFLGFKACLGAARPSSPAAKVVKNVTGYDLPKLMAGSWGTLGVLTEVTVKVLPPPGRRDRRRSRA
jgi:glycolate oxidase FAD binding subunit